MPQDAPPEDPPADDPAKPRPGYIPRPPSQADIDLVSGQQGMLDDEWSGEPPRPDGQPDPAKGKPD